jgi:hypothetical protein
VQVIASCPEGGSRIKDPWGRPLPACMVMERGEALDLWMERAQPDKYMAFSVRPLSHLLIKSAHELSCNSFRFFPRIMCSDL